MYDLIGSMWSINPPKLEISSLNNEKGTASR